jgi:hypothetical protein
MEHVQAVADDGLRYSTSVGALAFWRTVVQDRSNFLQGILDLLEQNGIRYCAVGGVAVNAYVEPVVTLDLDLVVAVDDVERVRSLAAERYQTEEFPHSIIVRDPDSGLQVQFQRDPGMAAYIERAAVKEVLGVAIPVAAPEDLVAAKVRAASDPARRPSKRQKDLADIARLLEAFPALIDQVPADIQERLVR